MNDTGRPEGVDLTGVPVNNAPFPVNWRGRTFHVRKIIEPSAVFDAVDDIVGMCVERSGAVLPEMEEYAVRAAVISAYTDILLPEDSGECYGLVFLTDLFETVVKNISKPQLESIRSAADKLIMKVILTDTWRSVWQSMKISFQEAKDT